MLKNRKQSSAKRKEASLQIVSANVDNALKEGQRVVKEAETTTGTNIKKIRLTGYVGPDIYKRIVNGMLEERMKKREQGEVGVQGKSDLSFVVSEAMEEWLEKRNY